MELFSSKNPFLLIWYIIYTPAMRTLSSGTRMVFLEVQSNVSRQVLQRPCPWRTLCPGHWRVFPALTHRWPLRRWLVRSGVLGQRKLQNVPQDQAWESACYSETQIHSLQFPPFVCSHFVMIAVINELLNVTQSVSLSLFRRKLNHASFEYNNIFPSHIHSQCLNDFRNAFMMCCVLLTVTKLDIHQLAKRTWIHSTSRPDFTARINATL